MVPIEQTETPKVVLSLAFAFQGARSDPAAVLKRLPVISGVEVLVCHASDAPFSAELDHLEDARPDLRVVPAAPGALIPEMWRDGFLAARGPWVATLTSHCPPDANWLRRAMDLVSQEATEDHAAFGGAIESSPDASSTERAVHLVRYVDAGANRKRGRVSDLSADNAVYRRVAVQACKDLLPDGFWEPNYHRRFLSAGLIMEFIPDLIVTHRNGYSAAEFCEQRRRHGRVFGRQRSEGRPRWLRWMMLLTSPAAFPIFAYKQTRKVISQPALHGSLAQAAMPFYGFIACWCLGEMCGYLDALRASSKRQE